MDTSIPKYGFWIALIAYFLTKSKTGKKVKPNIISSALFILTGAFIFGGVLFKLMHWPYASLLLIIGFGIGVIYLFSGLFTNSDDDEEEDYTNEIDDIGKS